MCPIHKCEEILIANSEIAKFNGFYLSLLEVHAETWIAESKFLRWIVLVQIVTTHSCTAVPGSNTNGVVSLLYEGTPPLTSLLRCVCGSVCLKMRGVCVRTGSGRRRGVRERRVQRGQRGLRRAQRRHARQQRRALERELIYYTRTIGNTTYWHNTKLRHFYPAFQRIKTNQT